MSCIRKSVIEIMMPKAGRTPRSLVTTDPFVLLDVEEAFNSVRQDGLSNKLYHTDLPRKLVRLFSSFVEDRSTAVQVETSIFRQVPLLAGTPKGPYSVHYFFFFMFFLSKSLTNKKRTKKVYSYRS